MRVLRLPAFPQFRDRLAALPLRNEDRVVAEALATRRLVGNAPFERAGAAKLASVRREEDELGDVARSALLDPRQLAQELRDRWRSLGRVPRGQDAGPAAERLDLEPRVLRQHPAVRVLSAEARLQRRVLVVRRAGLGRVVVAVERLDRPTRQEPLELTCLVPVARAEDYSIHRTSRTPSISATPATTAGAEPPVASSTSTATERRSPSCATSSDTTRPLCRSIASMTGAGL